MYNWLNAFMYIGTGKKGIAKEMGRYRDVQTEKDARSYAATIWWILWAVCFVIMLYTVWMQISEYRLVHNGKSIVAEYSLYKGVERATYYDEENHYHSYDLSGLGAAHGEDTIVLYYMDDINLAQPRIGFKTWLRTYAIFGVGLVLLSIRLLFIYKADHKIYDVGSTQIDNDY